MDWKHVATLSEHEQMRAWVENWKRIGPELERMKQEKLRAMTEEEAFDQAETLSNSGADAVWVDPKRANAEGLIEQQRLFQIKRSQS
jgi:hypothetical protein